jgi:putative endonuclease
VANEDRIFAVYITANRKNGTLYTGVTSDLLRRTWEHREGMYPGFSKKWGCTRLVWYEMHDLIGEAIRREKSIKVYRRQNKINLIEARNPDWKDLWFEITG